MKKVIVMLAVLCLAGCKQQSSETALPLDKKMETAVPEEEPVEKAVLLKSTPDHFEVSGLSAGASVTMINGTNEIITTGEYYHIEYFNGKDWLKVPFFDEIVFNDIGYELPEGVSRNFAIKFYPEKYDYKAGEYRVVKYYLKEDFRETKLRMYVYAPFVIEREK